MSAQGPLKGNEGGVFWSPELPISYGPVIHPDALDHRSSRPSRLAALRRWCRVCDWFVSIAEYLILFMAAATAAIAWPERGTSGQIIRMSFKRVFDIVGAAAGLSLTLPIFMIVPLLIKLDSPGPVFYLQDRVGLDRRRHRRRILTVVQTSDRRDNDRRVSDQRGQIFKLIKFRSMVQNAEKNCGPIWAAQNDPRVTRLGRFLRLSRIDEVPQLINVLLGQMSLVGPRPERPHFVSKFCSTIDYYTRRHYVKPGITGLAQVEHGYDSDENEVYRKVEYDLHYISRWTPLLDFRILLQTVKVVVSGRGAR